MDENSGGDRKPVVVGVDGSPDSVRALQKAAELARALDVPLEAVTAWQFPLGFDESLAASVWSPEEDAREILHAAVAEAFPGGEPDDLTRSVVVGPAARALISASEHATMLVTGSRGRGGFTGLLLGSVSTACAQHARCPALIVPRPRP